MRQFDDFIPKTTSTGIDEPEILSLFQPQAIKDISINGPGANAIDIGLHYIYRGVLTQNSTLLEGTRTFIDNIVADNIKPDLVYHDHGPQIQISSYGYVLANGITQLAAYLADTPAAFDVSSPNFSKVISFIRETQISSIRGSSWDFSVMGREVSRVNGLNVGLSYLQKMIDFIDPANATIYADALSRYRGTKLPDYNVKEFNKHYWSSDYTQHSRKGYLFAVRNVSTRTAEAETGNGENLKANYFSYGANFISVDGNEYKNIMPYWDWSMIPGTTFPFVTTFPTRTVWGTNFGSTKFVGGVSDGTYGASVLDFDFKGTKAKKSWFFFDNEVVCLGAGISDASGNNVRTTINQVKMEAVSYILNNGESAETKQSISASTYSNTNLLYLRNRNIGYFFPNQGNIKYSMKSQSGSWNDINSTLSTKSESGYVFSLWVDHGINPTNEGYSYIVVPGVDSEEKAQAYDASNIEIIENSVSVQAVKNKNLKVLQVIFHQAGTLSVDNVSITVNKPCALMIKNGTIVTLADPSQSNSVIVVTIVSNDIEYKKYISLNTDTGMDGTSVTVDFKIPTENTAIKSTFDILESCFPNPTNNGLVNITTKEDVSINYTILNMEGQTIFTDTFQKNTTIDLRDQPSGIYILVLNDGTHKYIHKIVKI